MKKWFWRFIIKHININISSIYGDLYKCNMYTLAIRNKFQGYTTPDNVIIIQLADNHKLIISLQVNI